MEKTGNRNVENRQMAPFSNISNFHSLRSCTRMHDIVHPNNPVDNGKGSSDKRADEVRHHGRSAKSLFSFFGFLLRFAGNGSI